MRAGSASAGARPPSRLRSFDPVRIGDLEYRAWVSYYLHRARAMDLSDQWVRAGCPPDSPLLALEHAALVRGYAALLAAVHH